MKKQLLTFAVLAAMGVAPMSAKVTIDGNDTEDFGTISAAMEVAETGATIRVTESYLEETTINPGTKAITIIGNNGVVVSFKGQYVVSLQNAACSLSIENLTFKNTLTDANSRSTFAIGRGSIYLTNVVIEGANTSNTAGIISLNNGNSNIPNAVLNNVKIIDGKTTAPAEVVVNNSNVTLSGDTELSIQLLGTNFIKSASGFTGKAALVLDDTRTAGSIVVKECTDPSLFTLNLEGYILLPKDGNLVLAETPAILNKSTYVGYTSLKEAVAAANIDDVLILNENIVLTDFIDMTDKTLTIKGATGEEKIVRDYTRVRTMFQTNAGTANLTLEDIVIDGNNAEITCALLRSENGAKISLNNIEIINSTTTNQRGLIDCSNGNLYVNGVKFTNCVVPNQLLTMDAVGNTVKGDNDMTMRINSGYAVDAAGLAQSKPLSVFVGTRAAGNTIFTNCSDYNMISLLNDGWYTYTNGSDILITNVKTAAPVASVANDIITLTAEDGATIYCKVTDSDVAPTATDFSEVYTGNIDTNDLAYDVNYVWAIARKDGAADSEVVFVGMFSNSGQEGITYSQVESAGQLNDGYWCIVVAKVGANYFAMNTEMTGISIPGSNGTINAFKEYFDNNKISEFRYTDGGSLVEKGTAASRAVNGLSVDGTNVLLDGAALKYDSATKTFGTDGDTTDIMLFTTGSDKNTGVDEIAVDSENAPVEYYNLQGMRVENPASGLYIKRQGKKVSKIYIK